MRDRAPTIQEAILAHLRAAATAVPSRDLAARFLKITAGDEETCRRLLAPFLAAVRGVAHQAGRGWMIDGRAPAASAASVILPEDVRAPSGEGLRDFIAFAADGAGPAGSGPLRVAAIVPVVAGEILPEEIVPSRAAAGGETGPGDEGSDAWSGDAGLWDEASARLPAAAGAGPGRDDLADLIETIGDLPIVCHRVAREVEPLRVACTAHGLRLEAPVISAAKIGHLLLGLKRNHAALDLATALGVQARGPDDCRGRARLVAEAFLALLPRLEVRGFRSFGALLEYQDLQAPPPDMGRYSFTAEDLKALPTGPGVYRFLDGRGDILYIGKARNLRTRVGSYFAPSARSTAKGRAILDQVRDLRVEAVASDLEAALLEAALLLEHRPPLNRQFDVHERPAPYGPRRNLAVVIPDHGAAGAAPGGVGCTVHLLREGLYLGRVQGSAPATASFRRRITSAFFPVATPRKPAGASPRRPPSGTDGRGNAVAIDWPIVSTWLAAHRDEVNVLDFDECDSARDACARLEILVRAAASGARVIARGGATRDGAGRAGPPASRPSQRTR